MKRQKTCEDNTQETDVEEFDLNSLLNKLSYLQVVPAVSSSDLIELIRSNIKEFVVKEKTPDEDETEGATSSLCLTKAVIDAFSQSNVVDMVKQNLFAKLGYNS